MSYLTQEQLEAMGFKHLGKHVKISDKASIYNADEMSIGDYVRIDDFSVISGKVSLGRNVYVAIFCNVAGGEKGITLSDFVTLAYGCQIFSQSDDYSGSTLTNPTVPDAFKTEIKKEVFIGRHVIIGTSATVFPGVRVAEGTSVGAHSLVLKDTQGWSVYFGVPAKRMKERKKDLLALEKKYVLSEQKEHERALN